MATTCIFCGSTGPMSREHVFAKRLRKLFPEEGAVGHFRSFEDLTGGQRSEEDRWDGTPFSFTVRDVCEACNNGWMNDLETEVAPVLDGMIRGEARTLTILDQDALARWATKTALVVMRAVPQPYPIPDEVARWFGENKRPLPRSYIALGKYSGDGGWPISVHQHGAKLAVEGIDPAKLAEIETNAFHSVFAVGNLAVSLVATHLEGDPNVGAPVPVARRRAIWPVTGEVDWPPRDEMNDRELAVDSAAIPGLEEMPEHLRGVSEA
jgi:hypothetical protein